MFHFLIKCGFALKIALSFDKTTIFHQIRFPAWKSTEVSLATSFHQNKLGKKTIKTREIGESNT